jgi:hypothetical protein
MLPLRKLHQGVTTPLGRIDRGICNYFVLEAPECHLRNITNSLTSKSCLGLSTETGEVAYIILYVRTNNYMPQAGILFRIVPVVEPPDERNLDLDMF